MPSPYAGIAGNVAHNFPVAWAILSSTNATPIEITTSANHGLFTGDEVDVHDHQVNTTANGRWNIHVTAANKFTLDGSSGLGVGGASGGVIPLGFQPHDFNIPSAGDARKASSVNVPLEAIADRVSFLAARCHPNGYNLVLSTIVLNIDDDTLTSWSSAGGISPTWAAMPNTDVFLALGVENGDLVETWINTTVSVPTLSTLTQIRFAFSRFNPGLSPAYGPLNGSGRAVANFTAGGGGGGFVELAMTGWRVISGNGTFQARVEQRSSQTIDFVGSRIGGIRVWRPN